MKEIKINCKILDRHYKGSVTVENEEDSSTWDFSSLTYTEGSSLVVHGLLDNYISVGGTFLGRYKDYVVNYIYYLLGKDMKVCEATGLYVFADSLIQTHTGKFVIGKLTRTLNDKVYEESELSYECLADDNEYFHKWLLKSDLAKLHKCNCGNYADDEHWDNEKNLCNLCANPRKVNIDTYINGRHIVGFIKYNIKTKHIDYTNLINQRYVGDTKEINFWDDCIFVGNVKLGTYKELFTNYVYYVEGDEDYSMCEETSYVFHNDYLCYLDTSDRLVHIDLITTYNDRTYLIKDCITVTIRNEYGRHSEYIPTQVLDNDYYYCEDCQCYVHYDDFDGEENSCVYCVQERKNSVIEEYCASHRHNDDPIYFGEFEEGDFQGLGFELEVNTRDYDKNHNEVASKIIEQAELEENELRYAKDGSIGNGFEIISEPHTIKCFWEKQDNWLKMLKYLVSEEYRSHNSGCCGLHIHVSRKLLGKNKDIQEKTIAKLYSFYEDNWEDLVKISRRENMEYCARNAKSWEGRDEYDRTHSKVKSWHKTLKSNFDGTMGHYVALNNANRHTFEFRLGRGTLNAWSFFSWIDLHITLCKNAKRITIGKVETNDVISWLSGIKESTAKYIYKRGAWKKEMLTLYPIIEWEGDLVERV